MMCECLLVLVNGARQFAETVKSPVQQADRIIFASGIRPTVETKEHACQRKPETKVIGIS